MIDKKQLTIVIPSMLSDRNQFALTECINSLEESGFSMENVIVSFNNIDEYHWKNKEVDLKGADHIAIFQQGQCYATNRVAEKVQTKYLMVSNDDMVYPPDWFERLTADYDGESVVSPQLIEPRKGAPTFKVHFCGGVGGDWDKLKFMEYAKNHIGQGLRSGFNLPFIVPTEVWRVVGGYDTRYDPWGSNSDSDLEYKFKLAGIKMLQNTDCPVYHFSQTSGTFHPDNRGYWNKNYKYFIKKWGFERAGSPDIWTAQFEIPYKKLKFRPKWAVLPQEQAS